MKLSILIVNWNTRDLAAKCINSILKHAPHFDFEIVIVDNASSDGSADTLVNLFGHNKHIRVIQSLRNLGFARANNLAFENSHGEFILMLNPDTEVRENALTLMVEYVEAHPGVGILGPKLLNPDGTIQHSVRRFPGIWSSVLVFSGLYRILRPQKYLMDDFSFEATADVDQVMGAALLTRRSIISDLGFLDDKFWLWYEEVDFCKRVKNAGYSVKFYPKAVVMHHGGEAFVQMPVYERKKTVAKSLIYYFKKHGHFWDIWLITILLPTILFVAKFLDFFRRTLGIKWKPHV